MVDYEKTRLKSSSCNQFTNKKQLEPLQIEIDSIYSAVVTTKKGEKPSSEKSHEGCSHPANRYCPPATKTKHQSNGISVR